MGRSTLPDRLLLLSIIIFQEIKAGNPGCLQLHEMDSVMQITTNMKHKSKELTIPGLVDFCLL